MKFLATAAVLLLIMGCSVPEESTTGGAETVPSIGEKIDSERREAEEALADELKRNFGMPGYETSWYGNIIKVELKGDTAIAHTNLDAVREAATGVCGAVSGFVFANQNVGLGITRVHVMGTQGPLIQRNSLRDPCR